MTDRLISEDLYPLDLHTAKRLRCVRGCHSHRKALKSLHVIKIKKPRENLTSETRK